LFVYDRVLQAASDGVKDKRKSAIIVKGGPGTGKSVIAMNLLGDLSAKGLNTHEQNRYRYLAPPPDAEVLLDQ
jgi:uncharacterized protein